MLVLPPPVFAGDEIQSRSAAAAPEVAAAAAPPEAEAAVFEHSLARPGDHEMLRARTIWQPAARFAECSVVERP